MAAKQSSIGAAAGKTKKSAGKSSSTPKETVTSLTDAQIAALESITGATLGELKDGKYSVTIPATKNISPASLSDSAKLAVQIQEIATSKQTEEIQEKISKAVESGTISKGLKILNKVIKPATKAAIKI
jgi:hypothetical protein|tara:strand:- start:1267 stop:1653 length:387 start_codon:yes stop_codon:yes gene_type:complete